MEIRLIQIQKEVIKPLVTLAFEGDRDLLETYHVSPGNLEHCVNHTCAFIESNKDFYKEDMFCYRVEIVEGETSEVIGFTVVIKHEEIPNELYSFGIAKQFRKKEILQAWLMEIETIIGLLPYYLILWSVNTRAIEFFQKNGFISEQRDALTKLIIKWE